MEDILNVESLMFSGLNIGHVLQIILQVAISLIGPLKLVGYK